MSFMDQDGDIGVKRSQNFRNTFRAARQRSRSRSRSRDRQRNCSRDRQRHRSRSRSVEIMRSRSRSQSPGWRSEYDKTAYRIPPYHYIHALDQNTNITFVEKGPQTFIRKDNVRVTLGPEKMIVVPPRHYCIIGNPVCRDGDGNLIVDSFGQIKLQHAEREIRFAQDPFPLYPGEIIDKDVSPLKVIPANAALRLRAILDFKEDNGTQRTAGDEWLFEGPGTYIPRKETCDVETVRAKIIGINEALCLRARKDCIDRDGVMRVTGEEWQVKKIGAYLPGAYEEVVNTVKAQVLTDSTALHLVANKSFVDDYGVQRKNGEMWMITLADTDTHILNVYESLVSVSNIITLSSRQYCVILNPLDGEGKPQFGKRKLMTGEKSFFLRPGESLERGIQNIYILGEEEGLILKASESFMDGQIKRSPGDRWMIRGPTEYVPSVEVEVVTKRHAIALDENEGVYVRNIKTGKVSVVHGQTYMLNQDEELWQKKLSPVVESLLFTNKDPLADRSVRSTKDDAVERRDESRVVTLRVPHNAAVQVYDYKDKKARVVFGPDLVMLGSDEQFTQLSLSGSTPKKPNVIRALCLLLGPDFCTDRIVVETADHAKLSLQLAYNWHFDVSTKSEDVAAKLFSVPDFIGDFCKSIASKVRGAVAQVAFDELHKKSSQVICSAVFGVENGNIKDSLVFPQNNLVITSVDIQSVEPVDQRTRDSLQRSVQLAIEITTNSQEAAAKHEAQRLEQEAKGRLERQKIMDESGAETARKKLLELQAQSTAVESTGHAKAEAQSRAETSRIEGQVAVERAKLQAEALNIESEAELNRLKRARSAELSYVEEQTKLDLQKASELADIEVKKFQQMVESIGSNTLLAMATAGPDMQVRMLQSLGLKSTLITDGSSPINLFNTASGLIGGDLIPAKRRRVDESSRRAMDGDDESDTAS